MTAKEALKEIEKQFFVKEGNTTKGDFGLYVRLKAIETALNRLEELENKNRILKVNIGYQNIILNIIKQKGVNTNLMFDKDCEDVKTYNEIIKPHIYMRYLTETEFNLLKEYLK